MTYGKDYKLAEKMQKQFKNRGSDVSGMQASSTSELMRRAEMGHDPRVNCAEQAFRESYRSRNAAQENDNRIYDNAYAQPGRQQRSTSSRPASSSGTGAYGYAQNSTQRKNRRSENIKTQKARTTVRTEREVRHEPLEEAAEVRVKQKGFSPAYIALLIVGTLMVMMLVLSISEAYQTTNEIARLEADLEALQLEAAELRLQLEEKNDIRTIEQIATEELGMVKEDSLQRRYISLSDGEYIELLNTEEESEEQTGGVLLSSIFSSLGRFFERFK